MTIQQYLATEVLQNRNGVSVKVIPNTLPVKDQIEYLMAINFKLLASKESTKWRLENLYYIMDKNARKVLFRLNPAQNDFFDNVISKGYKRAILLKSRQLGFTTFIAIYFLDGILFNPNSDALQIAHTLLASKDIFSKKIKFAINNLPKCLMKDLELSKMSASRAELTYPDNSVSSISTAASGRSGNYRYLHISELAKLAKAYPEKATEVVTGSIPSVPIDGIVIIESTAEGQNSVFYDMYMSSFKRKDKITPAMSKSEFYPVFYNWRWDTEQIELACVDGTISTSEMEECEINWAVYQEENGLSDKEITYYYHKWVSSNKNMDNLHQEFPLTELDAFISTGSNFFNAKKISELYNKCEDQEYQRYDVLDGGITPNPIGDLWIKEQPKLGKSYVVGADTAEGLSDGDYSVAFVLGYDKDIKAFYKGHLEPDDFSKLLVYLGNMYNTALLAVESNGPGNWVNTNILSLGYNNIFLRTSFDDITRTMSKSYGWRTDVNSRKFMLDETKAWFSKQENINCKLLLEEMMVFVRNKRGKPVAQAGKHDDMVMSIAVALAVMHNWKEKQESKPVASGLMSLIYAS